MFLCNFRVVLASAAASPLQMLIAFDFTEILLVNLLKIKRGGGSPSYGGGGCNIF
jgi:hypothetical protein